MNYLKLLTDVLKARDKERTRGKKFPYSYGKYETNDGSFTAISPNGHGLVFIPDDLFYLDIEKCFHQAEPLNVKKIVNEDDLIDTYITDISRVIPAKGITVQIFKNDNDEIWIDVNLLKYFDLSDCHFKGTNKISPLYIYENETLVGLLMPIRQNL